MGEYENATPDEIHEIHKDVEEIKKQVAYIYAMLLEKMSDEDRADYEQAMKEYKEGKTTKLSDLHW